MKGSAVGIGFNGAETNCGIAHISGILLINSCNTVTKNRCVTHVKICEYANFVSSLLAYLISTVVS